MLQERFINELQYVGPQSEFQCPFEKLNNGQVCKLFKLGSLDSGNIDKIVSYNGQFEIFSKDGNMVSLVGKDQQLVLEKYKEDSEI